ncbi:MAG TPA: OsmC family protein [Labilithrix sp.]|jgi:putative redox protein
MTIRCTTETAGHARHRITIGSHEVFADLTVPEGGDDTAPGAHDYFDASLAACKALTAIWYARKNAMPLDGVDVEVDRDDSEERKGRYVLKLRVALRGALSAEQRERILAAIGRCPVSKLMTTSEVVIETTPS